MLTEQSLTQPSVESAARPRRQLEEIPEDRKESETAPVFKMQESNDPDARWLKKGKRCYFGYKMFVSAQEKFGFINNLAVTPANQSEASFLPKLLQKSKNPTGQRIYADKGYASFSNRNLLKEKRLKDGIMEKGSKGKILRAMQKIKNKLISKKRYIIEQTFGTLKRRLCFSRTRYLTQAKVEGEAYRKAICLNLIKAVRMVKLDMAEEQMKHSLG